MTLLLAHCNESRKLRHLVGCVLVFMLIAGIVAAAQLPKPKKPAFPPQASPNQPLTASHQLTASDVGAFLDGAVPQQLQREDIAGAVVVIVKDGKVLFSKGYGYADVKKAVPVSPDGTMFRPGSISKTFTWTAVMQLVEQGKLNLDHDVNEYLDFQVPHTFGKPVTLRNLMTHTPGFEEVIKDLMVERVEDLPSIDSFIKAHQPKQIYAPGTVPAYSNYGADLAGYIVQRVSGLPFEEYIQKNIFQPLGMAHATFIQPLPDSLKPLVSNGYEVASEDAKPFELIPPTAAPDGSLSVTGSDMAHFMIAHLQDGTYGNVHILQPQTAQMMHARQFGMDPALNAMCLGFYEESRNGHRIIGHGGDLNYFHSDMHLVLDQGLGFFVSYNSSGKGELDPRTPLWQNFLDRYFPVPEPSPSSAQKASDSLAGKYLSSRRAQTTILRSLWWLLAEASVSQAPDGTIQVDSMKDIAGQPKRWRGVGSGQFREVGGQDLLVFKRDESGNLEMVSEDPVEIFQKASWTENKIVVECALVFALLVFLLTLIFWPISALVRRHYKRQLTLEPNERKWRRIVRLGCALDLGTLVAFAAIAGYGISSLTFFSWHLDPWIRLLQILMVVGLVAAGGTIYAAFRMLQIRGFRFWRSIYTGGLVLACFIYIWFVFAARILQGSLKY